MNRTSSVILLVMLSLLGGACGDERGTETVESRPAADDDNIIKMDYEGAWRVPTGTQLVSLVHQDPYRWDAELSFTDRPALDVALDLLGQIKALEFESITPRSISPVATGEQCADGAIRLDGSADCRISAVQFGDGGYAQVIITRAALTEPGTVRITRVFAHRALQDPIGPPHPPQKTSG